MLLAHGTLMLTAHTGRGRLFAVAGCALGLALIFAGMRRVVMRRLMPVASIVAVVGYGVVLRWAPDGRSAPEARVQNRYVGDGWGYRRFALGNLVPELDQFRLGFRVVSRLDPLFDVEQAERLSAWTTAIYDRLEADPEFRALGSAMPHAYADLRGGGAQSGHYFLYVPERLKRDEPQPVLVFLHGSGGNFKAYTWLLSRVADRAGCVVVAPSFGLGDWRAPESARVVDDALDDARRVVALDATRMHLMGLSNGGLGVSQIAAAEGGRFSSLVFLSPVFDEGALSSLSFASKWRGREVLVMSGVDDKRTPIDYVSREVGAMREDGVRVDLEPYEGADHFLFFSHTDAVQARLETWLSTRMEEAR